jgi:hypothetical protein
MSLTRFSLVVAALRDPFAQDQLVEGLLVDQLDRLREESNPKQLKSSTRSLMLLWVMRTPRPHQAMIALLSLSAVTEPPLFPVVEM